MIYQGFSVGGADTNYRLHLGTLVEGNAPDAFRLNDGLGFSARDRDNDVWTKGSCASSFRSG